MKSHKTKGQPLPAPNKTRPSDILAIPLGDDFFGYARVCKGTFLQILDRATKGIVPLKEIIGTNPKFWIEFYEPYDESPWIYLGKWPFGSEDEAWGPPVWFGVPFKYISEQGVVREASEKDICGVQEQQLVHPNNIVDRVIESFSLKIPKDKRSRIK